MSPCTAQALRAEIDADMGRFGTAGRLASLAGVSPGNYESAGRQSTDRARHGDPWLKAVLGWVRSRSRPPGPRAPIWLPAIGVSPLAAVRSEPWWPWSTRCWSRPGTCLPMTRSTPTWAETTSSSTRAKARQPRRLVSHLNQLGYHGTLQVDGAA
ncbi:transposase [Nocardiopsis sp. FR6]|uniref:transposase n=1 Tax=Nocardiopsis sp. FR6 TaxID=2605986 RepID=UPI00135A205E